MFKRRSLLLGGAASLLAGIAGSSVLTARAALREGFAGSSRPRAATPKRLIMVLAGGGWDVTCCLDPKLHAPEIEGPEVDFPEDEGLATYGGITIASNTVARPQVDAFFEQWHEKVAIINGIRVDAIAHGSARARMLTGSRVQGKPDLGAIAGATLGGELPLGYIDAGGSGRFGALAASSGRIGYQSQLRMLVDRAKAYPAPEGSGVTYPQYLLSETDVSAGDAYLRARSEQLRAGRGSASARDLEMMAALDEARERASRLIDFSPQFSDSLRLGRHPDAADLATLTAELLRAEVCQSILLSGGEDFDTHQNNVDQHASFNGLFETLSLLSSAIEDAGLWDDTVMLVTSDFTRTPKRNAEAGKNHWPINSAIVMGAGVKPGGAVYGGTTDDTFDARRVDFATGQADDAGDILSFEHLGAGLLELIGVDAASWLPGAAPFTAYHA